MDEHTFRVQPLIQFCMIILQPFFALLCGTAEFTVLEHFRVNMLQLS